MMHTATDTAHEMSPRSLSLDDQRWRAVLVRDRAFDGRFVYAVSSTGIFCRPTCPSRRPRRERVAFFDTPDAASAAGYRPCLRCRPLEPRADVWGERIRLACQYLSHADGAVTLPTLAARVGTSAFHLQRNFKRIVGVTPREFAEARRLARVKRALRGDDDVTTAFTASGYGSSSRFYERAAPRLGMSPSEYRSGAAGQSIRYATADSPIGAVLVGATDRGVCTVTLGAQAADLVRSLRREFPGATFVEDAHTLRPWLRQIVNAIQGRTAAADVPLDVRATAFQWQVWTALRTIPPGETRTYAEVAASLGRRGSARAVARACAANPVAIAVPCHRVVPAAGGVGGYRWGARRKADLLAREQHPQHPAPASESRRKDASGRKRGD